MNIETAMTIYEIGSHCPECCETCPLQYAADCNNLVALAADYLRQIPFSFENGKVVSLFEALDFN